MNTAHKRPLCVKTWIKTIWVMTLSAICLAVLLVTACGRKADLYMPEPPAEVKQSTATPEPTKQEDKDKEKEKKDKSQSTE